MTETIETPVWTASKKTALVVILAIWASVAAYIGNAQLLPNTGGYVIPPIVITVAIPVLVFTALYLLSNGFRRFVLAQDIETLTMLQHWRVIGFAFLPLYFYGALPAVFAYPAGIGDVALGLSVPFVIMRLRSDPAYATSTALVRFHYLGLLDFVVAALTAGLTAGAFAALTPDGVTSAAIDVWPLNMFPSFMVPIFIILHLTVLLKVRELRQRQATGAVGQLQTA